MSSIRSLLKILLLPLMMVSAACTAPQPSPVPEETAVEIPRPSNLLLITVDTLRADHLSVYGYQRATSPVIDRLASEGLRFEQPAVQWPKTGPSFASIFTSTYPKDNGIVRKVGIPLPCRFRMLAETLQEAGYQTHAVVANGAVGSDFGFDQGFDSFQETWKLEPGDPEDGDANRAAVVNRLARDVIEGLDKDRPYFLWLHYLDPHHPYAPPGEWRDRFQEDELWDGERKIEIFDSPRRQMLGIGQQQVIDGRDEMAFYVARYDAEISYVDSEIGRILELLGERGLMEKTLTAFTSDHGESLGDHHYYFDHGRFGFEDSARVPLILHYPGVIEIGVDPHPVQLLDLAPTFLDFAGIELEDGRWAQGRSLVPRLFGQEDAEGSLAYLEAGYEMDHRWQKIVRDRRFKLVLSRGQSEQRWIGGVGVPLTLFDLQDDPDESENAAERFPDDFARLEKQLWQWTKAEPFDALLDPPGCGEETETDPETIKQLEALGYL